MHPMQRQSGFQTACVHGGDQRNRSGHVSPPICQSTTFELPDPTEGARRAADIAADEFYGRWGSANARELESLVASLEQAEEAVCASSGLAIIAMAAHAFLRPKTHLIGVHQCYGETRILLEAIAERCSVDASFVDSDRLGNFAKVLRPDTAMVFVETPANPTLSLVDVRGLADLVHANPETILVVDSTFATPFNQRPLEQGADVVVHSATKYLGGHSDVVAGVCAASGRLAHRVREQFSLHGPHLDPFAAWLLCRGIRTLGLRMERHNRNASRLAAFLEGHPKVARVHYPMLPSHPQFELARRQMTGGGGMICFEVKGGRRAALELISRVRLSTLAVSLGGVSSLITHPVTMTHNELSPEALEEAGITDAMLRFSVGIEDDGDIQADLEQAFEAVDVAEAAAVTASR